MTEVRKFLSLTMRFRPDLTIWEDVHNREKFHPGDVAIAAVITVAKSFCFICYPCCGDIVDHTDGPHAIGRDDLERVSLRPSIACRGCGAHYVVTSGAIVEGEWADPARAAEWATRYPNPPRPGLDL